MEIVRPGALYKQVAAAIREGIDSGEYPPGTPLPSETQLMARYEVSRPTVRNAMAELRTQGLIDVIHGKGSFVRATPTGPAATIERTVTHTGNRYATPADEWEQAEEPTVYRATTDATTGPLLGLDEDEALFAVDRLITDPATGARALHRLLIPFATADQVPLLAEQPDQIPAKLYALLATASHGPLSWRETVRARMPQPDERATLDMPEATPVLHTYRVTLTDDRPLTLEELRTSADTAELTYRITAGK